ncbi:MAG: non-ribosomal peptide synthetase [Chloroflexi bacterium]|nr:non-ribosomal peptide synthetase [Chloroflexota bacterium]
MSTDTGDMRRIPASQQAIIDKCFHPSGTFVEFKKEWIEQSIPLRFEEAVRRYPDRIAVKTDARELTYVELNGAANRIAHAILGTRGDGEEPVALLFDHGVNGIAAIMGALKAGKTCVLLVPSHPSTRTLHILRDSTAALIVTDSKNLPLAKELAKSSIDVIDIDELNVDLSDENLDIELTTDALAFILYTSGSTGRAKGVSHNHGGVLHMTRVHTNSYHICPEDRVSLLFSPGAIGAAREIIGTLLNGGCLYPFDLKAQGIPNLADWLVGHQITTLRTAGTVFRHFVNGLTGSQEFPNLRLVHIGTEMIYRRDVEQFKKHFSAECILTTGLGMTEISPVLIWYADMETEIEGGTVSGGYAVEGTEIIIVDESDREVAVNEVGEIIVRSPYISPGYWGMPGQMPTAPALDLPGMSTYRTNDLGRRLPDGRVVCLGRKDFQVNLRGHLIEIADVESALLDLDYVEEAAMMLRVDRNGDERLVAYVVPGADAAPSTSVLRRALSETLPDHMVPSSYVILDALPLAPNGKVDRKSLPVLDKTRPDLDVEFAAPRTPVEVQLSEIWAEALDLDEVGIYDNFFDLGGHSLMASHILSLAIKTFRVELPLKALFESPTVAEMAIVVTEHQADKVGPVEIDQMLSELDALTDRQARRLLADDVPVSQREGRGT